MRVSRRMTSSRICILKGIHLRYPKKKPNASQTYYRVKGINYIANEPVIDYFRHMKSFLKKICAFPFRWRV